MPGYVNRLPLHQGRGQEGTKQVNSTQSHVSSFLRNRRKISKSGHISAFTLLTAFSANFLISWQ